jgi:phosphatidylserine decarboxylase
MGEKGLRIINKTGQGVIRGNMKLWIQIFMKILFLFLFLINLNLYSKLKFPMNLPHFTQTQLFFFWKTKKFFRSLLFHLTFCRLQVGALHNFRNVVMLD